MPCGTIMSLPSAACNGTKACQQDGTLYSPIGAPTGATCVVDQTGLVPTVTYPGTPASGSSAKRGVKATYNCDQSVSGLPFTVEQTTLEVDTYYYPFDFRGSGACRVVPHRSDPSIGLKLSLKMDVESFPDPYSGSWDFKGWFVGRIQTTGNHNDTCEE
ncbi:uncharacterized protein LOC134853349 [Symsagittifera roscoffensis]|uniref:uncharacterized protein LOC134853349 n=1 Tax=Symsagittifera roscoffensis TaxID=84072 RepID=UPI00307B7C95